MTTHETDETPPPSRRPVFELTASRQFTSWLAETGASLALTTYQSGKVILVGSNPATGRLSVFERTLQRPMGLAFKDGRLAVAMLTQITVFVDAAQGQKTADGYDGVFVPQLAYYTADLDAHDVAFDAEGRIVFVNTLFSCLAAVSPTHSFRPLWKPPFISRLAAEDRCHLNGLAMRDGAPAYVTAVAPTDIADGWRDRHTDGGGWSTCTATRSSARGCRCRTHRGCTTAGSGCSIRARARSGAWTWRASASSRWRSAPATCAG
jgi:uncharacterized protein (TIGR03032 family)